MEQEHRSWVGLAWTFPRRLLARAKAQVRRRYGQLKARYGAGYTRVMFAVVVLSFFSPIPASSLAGIALIVLIAEAHRAVSRSGVFRRAGPRDGITMSIKCELVVDRNATPEQLTALGCAMWRWFNRTTRSPGIYPLLDSQVLADLIAGNLPAPGQTPEQSEQLTDGVHFRFRDEESRNRDAAVAGLRRDIPNPGVVDILVGGISWGGVPVRDLAPATA